MCNRSTGYLGTKEMNEAMHDAANAGGSHVSGIDQSGSANPIVGGAGQGELHVGIQMV